MKNKHRKVLNVYCWMPSKGFVGRLTKKKMWNCGDDKKNNLSKALCCKIKSINVGTSIPNVHCIELWISCK